MMFFLHTLPPKKNRPPACANDLNPYEKSPTLLYRYKYFAFGNRTLQLLH